MQRIGGRSLLALGITIALYVGIYLIALLCCGNPEEKKCLGPSGYFIGTPRLELNNCSALPLSLSRQYIDARTREIECGSHKIFESDPKRMQKYPCWESVTTMVAVSEAKYQGFIVYEIKCDKDSGYKACAAIWIVEFEQQDP